jgi:hypothetical protein
LESVDDFAFLLDFLAFGVFVVFLVLDVVVVVDLSVELVVPCANARPVPSISVTTNISSFFMPSPSKI